MHRSIASFSLYTTLQLRASSLLAITVCNPPPSCASILRPYACRRDSNMQTHQAIVDCRYTFPKEDNVSSEAKDLIKHMMCLVSMK